MSLKYVPHEKINLSQDSDFDEQWLHARICDDPSILGLGDVRVLDRERTLPSAGRLDLLLFDEDNNRRYEVEVMLGATDPSHIIRTIEYWDIERRRFPAYDHVAVLIAEAVTSRFLNVISLLSGSIPLIVIQLDALRVGDQIVLNFVQVLDQTELRIDDTEEDGGGGAADREYWNHKAGSALMKICDQVLVMVNEASRKRREFNYLRGYIGLQSGGVVKNFVWLSPKPTKKIVHVGFQNANAASWRDRFEQAGVPVQSWRSRRFRVTVTPQDFEVHQDLIRQAILETVTEADA